MRHRQRERQTQPLQELLMDGRANVSFGTGDPVVEAFQQASRPRDAGVSTLIVDTEPGTIQLQPLAAPACTSPIWPPTPSRPLYACRSAAGAKAMDRGFAPHTLQP